MIWKENRKIQHLPTASFLNPPVLHTPIEYSLLIKGLPSFFQASRQARKKGAQSSSAVLILMSGFLPGIFEVHITLANKTIKEIRTFVY